MAVLDPVDNTIVIRIVYDGPAFAGKTTSVRALAGGLGVPSVTPDELAGRTLYFDWLDYTGGLFEGRQIRCQVVSVPGQTVFEARRRYLIDSADAVVFVGDSTEPAQSSVLDALTGLRDVLAEPVGPPVGIVFQANKRDHVDAVPIAALRRMLELESLDIAIVESVATQGDGIREAFVFAVRLALDRVRELMRLGTLANCPPRVDSSDALLQDLRGLEGEFAGPAATPGLAPPEPDSASPSTMLASALVEAVSANDIGHETASVTSRRDSPSLLSGQAPSLPGSTLPSGMIWPPVNGRIFLHEAGPDTVDLQVSANGDWGGRTHSQWNVHSPRAARYSNLDEGREALIKWARLHAASATVISPQRCVVLADDGLGAYRLWQIVRVGPTLREELVGVLKTTTDAIINSLLTLPGKVLQAAELWTCAGCWLPLKLSSVGTAAAQGRYMGLMPIPSQVRPVARPSPAIILEELPLELQFVAATIRSRNQEALAALDQTGAMTTAQEDHVWTRKFIESLKPVQS